MKARSSSYPARPVQVGVGRPEKIPYKPHCSVALLGLRNVSAVGNNLDAACRDRLPKFLRVASRNKAVVRAPHNQGGRRDAMESFMQTALGYGPHELPRASDLPINSAVS